MAVTGCDGAPPNFLDKIRKYVRDHPGDPIADNWAEMLVKIDQFGEEYTERDFEAAMGEAQFEADLEQLEHDKWEQTRNRQIYAGAFS